MGQYYRAVVLTKDGSGNGRTDVFTFPGSLKLTEHSWNGNSDVAEVINEVRELGSKPNNTVRVAWVGDYSYDILDPDEHPVKRVYHSEGFTVAWGDYAQVQPKRGHPEYGLHYAVNDDLKEAVLICGVTYDKGIEEKHGEWWMCAWPILNAVGNGEGGGDYHGVNEHLAGRWAYDRQRILDHVPEGYTELPAHLFEEEGMSTVPAQKVNG